MSKGISLTEWSQRLKTGEEVAPEVIPAAAEALLSEAVDASEKEAFLRALAEKGESVEELAGFVEAFLQFAVNPGLEGEEFGGPLIDVCGTGGDRLDLFNVSTASMFVLAGGGAVVVKHGNRSISSQCGGADVLEALGVKIDLPVEGLKERLKRHGLGFLFAPLYHPAFKVIAPVRKSLAAQGVTSMFNLLGPLLNPARPDHQLVGIFSEGVLPKYAATLQRIGRKRAWAVVGRSETGAGMDEISTLGPTTVFEVSPKAVEPRQIELADLGALGLCRASLSDVVGGTKEENAEILLGILKGELRGPKRDLVELNAGAGFVVAELAGTLEEGVALARESIDSGRALGKLSAIVS